MLTLTAMIKDRTAMLPDEARELSFYKQICIVACAPAHPCRGKGIARALVQLVTSQCSQDIYLTTLASRVALYAQHGFRVLPIQEVPK